MVSRTNVCEILYINFQHQMLLGSDTGSFAKKSAVSLMQLFLFIMVVILIYVFVIDDSLTS